MSRIDDLWATFENAKKEAEDYYKSCERFCNVLADQIIKSFGCQSDCEFGVEHERINKRKVLAITFPVSLTNNIPIRYIVTRKDSEFAISIEGTQGEFPANESGLGDQFAPIIDATYKKLENTILNSVWQVQPHEL